MPHHPTHTNTQYQYDAAAHSCMHVILRTPPHTHMPRPTISAPHYLHSVWKTLPPPWARPWSDVHWPGTEPTQLVRWIRRCKHSDKSSTSSLFSWAGIWLVKKDLCTCCTPTCMTEDSHSRNRWNRWVTCSDGVCWFLQLQALFVLKQYGVHTLILSSCPALILSL